MIIPKWELLKIDERKRIRYTSFPLQRYAKYIWVSVYRLHAAFVFISANIYDNAKLPRVMFFIWHGSNCHELCISCHKSVTTYLHCNDVIMSVMASQIPGVKIVHSTVCSGSDQWKHQSTASLAFVRGIHRWPVISPHKGPITRQMITSSCLE